MDRDPTIIAGDLDNNVIWDRPGWPMNHATHLRRLNRRGLVSAYNHLRGEADGTETEPTHYRRDRREDRPTYHIDYMFLQEPWLGYVENFSVGKQRRCSVRGRFKTGTTMALHIPKFKPQNPMTAAGEAMRNGLHKYQVHRCARAMGQHEQGF